MAMQQQAIGRSRGRSRTSPWRRSRVAANGLATHPLASASGPLAARDLADAVHLLCSLYGRHPGLVELSLGHAPAGPVRDWLREASDAFERERLYLVRLTAAVGPCPRPPARPRPKRAWRPAPRDRDPGPVRAARLRAWRDDRAGRRLARGARRARPRRGAHGGRRARPARCPTRIGRGVIHAGIDGAAAERALGFGGEQLLLQNRGLFDLLEARAEARGDC
jgi:hypothetical protein